nr:LysM peptidoglycan-binding domain-containing protein [uncultured Oscillibacter sp.]
MAIGGTLPQNLTDRLLSATYTDNEEDAADDLQISYDNAANEGNKQWLEVKATIAPPDTGKLVQKEVAPTETIDYIVQRGDTLSAIAAKYLGSASKYNQIVQENGIKNPDLIFPGQVFKITTGGQVTATPTEAVQDARAAGDTDTQGGAGNAASGGGSGAGSGPAATSVKMVQVQLAQLDWNGSGRSGVLNCGTFEIDSAKLAGPPMKTTLSGTSIPYTSTLRMQKKCRSWENTSLQAIAAQIAAEAGLSLMYECAENPKYSKKEQVQQSDIRFLQTLCHAEGKALKITALSVVIFDKQDYDGKPPIKTITYGSSDILSFNLSTNMKDTAYTSCHVSYSDSEKKETIEYTFTPDSSAGTGQVLEINEKVADTAEAMRIAKKRLREKNEGEITASFSMVGDVQLVAGVVVQLRGFQSFDRKYRVKSAKHKLLGGYTTDIELVQILEGY